MSEKDATPRRLKTGEDIHLTMLPLTDERAREFGRWEASARWPCGNGVFERYALGWTPEEAVEKLRQQMGEAL